MIIITLQIAQSKCIKIDISIVFYLKNNCLNLLVYHSLFNEIHLLFNIPLILNFHVILLYLVQFDNNYRDHYFDKLFSNDHADVHFLVFPFILIIPSTTLLNILDNLFILYSYVLFGSFHSVSRQ